MATKLGLYNEALLLLGERKIASLAENREPRRVLDAVWDNGTLDNCLEQGLWTFATRAVRLEYDSGIEPEFGYRHAFPKPEDFIRTVEVGMDEYFNQPLLQYTEEAGFIFSNFEELFIRYVSNDVQYGADFSLWPQTFTRYVACYMAVEACETLTQSSSKYDKLYAIMGQRLNDARSKDAMQLPTQFPPSGLWARSRQGRNVFTRGRIRG